MQPKRYSLREAIAAPQAVRFEEIYYSLREAAELTFTPYDLVDYYARRGHVKPSYRQASGTGSRRAFSFADLVALMVVRSCRVAEVSFKFLRPAVELIQKTKDIEDVPHGAALIIDGEGRAYIALRSLTPEGELRYREWLPGENNIGGEELNKFSVETGLGSVVSQLKEVHRRQAESIKEEKQPEPAGVH